MVKRKLRYAIKALFLFATLTAAQHGYARTVKKITITEVGKSVNQKDEAIVSACKRFRPTIKQLHRYFNNAYPVESYIGTTERYSDCYATGTIEFSDNSKGVWRLKSSGTSGITWTRGDYVDLFYKHNKWYDPFACSYGLSDEGEC
ncbi:hypothetical protein ACS7SF_09385 [Ralstonia sp. 25C]|uniref:hypothetical protein n=1 Tax=Ralstonia sp. 25C TaxID=3447363 RepID=UPI003F7541DB